MTFVCSYKPQRERPKPGTLRSATWQSSFDSSKVWAQKFTSITAGSDTSCPNAGAIDCLLLQSIRSQEGPTGGKLLTKTTFIQRLNTKGDLHPLPTAWCPAMWVAKCSCPSRPISSSSERTTQGSRKNKSTVEA